MKKLLFILLGAFMLSTTNVFAQEQTKAAEQGQTDARAEKLSAKEAKRKAKEEAKAKKEAEKAEKARAKSEKKDKKIAKLEAEYYEFLANYEPLDTNTGVGAADTLFMETNDLFATLVNVEQNIGFIDVRTHKEVDEITEDTIQVLDGVYNKNTGEEIQKDDALKAYTEAGLQLTTAALTATNLSMQGANVVLGAISDPMALITVGGKVKKVIKTVKMSANMIPIIQRRIKENKEALNFKKNN